MRLKKTLFTEDCLKDSLLLSWIARSIHRNNAVKYVQLTLTLGTWRNRHFWAMHEEKPPEDHCSEICGIIFLFQGHQRRAGQSMHKRRPQEILIAPHTAILVFSSENLTVPPPLRNQPLSSQISSHFSKEDVLSAEVLWAIETLMVHSSSNSSAGTDKLFAKMFPDSQIAKQFQCGKTKCSYISNFDLAPYFKGKLMKKTASSRYKVCDVIWWIIE